MEQSRITQDDVLFGYRLQLFDLAALTSVSRACRTFGGGSLDVLRVEAPGRPSRVGDTAPARAPAPADARRLAADDRGTDSELCDCASRVWCAQGRGRARPTEVGRDRRLTKGACKILRRHGLNTRAKRLALVADYARPMSHRANRRPSATSTFTGRARWSASTASPSGACARPTARSGN
jgi:hypothetical protein